jgi:HK97 gp10 family phage protein
MATGIKIKGLDKLLAKVERINGVLQEDVDIIVREGANDMNNQVVRNIGSQGLVDLGFLRNSQHMTPGPNSRQYRIHNSAPYAPYHEFGTGGMTAVPANWGDIAIQFKGRGIRIVNIRPRPFLVPAFNQYSILIVKDVQDAIKNALK